VAAAIANCGRLDIVVNNAGTQIVKLTTLLDTAEWEHMMGVNLAIPYLARQGGVIVNIASVHAHATSADCAGYAASKAGMLGLTRGLALQRGPVGIRVNAVTPGTIETPLLLSYVESCSDPPAMRRQMLSMQPVGRLATPGDIGALVAFLASDGAAFITGEIMIDGGMTAALFH
jgi:NAD(P)-dependent dehydrogenase (short-subunit alcohol dehydrogenase family)